MAELPKIKCDKCGGHFPKGDTTRFYLEGRTLTTCIPCRKKLIS